MKTQLIYQPGLQGKIRCDGLSRKSQSRIPWVASATALQKSGDATLIAEMRVGGHPIVQVNPAFPAITDCAAAEAIGKNCRYLQASDRLQPAIAEALAALTESGTAAATLRNRPAGAALQRSKIEATHATHEFAAADEQDARNRIRQAIPVCTIWRASCSARSKSIEASFMTSPTAPKQALAGR